MFFDVITFGSATNDIFVKLQKEQEKNGKFCFPLGKKISAGNLSVFSGGGGTNTACSFSNLGLRTAYVGKVGRDVEGNLVFEDLKRFLDKSFKLSTSFLQKDENYKTAMSVILSSQSGERTALVTRGACHFMKEQEIPWKKIKRAEWFYLAPLSEKTAKLFAPIVDFAMERGIKVAVNPGNSQLSMPRGTLLNILSKTDVLILNRDEAGILSGIPKDETAMIKKIAGFYNGIIIITLGRDGALVYNNGVILSSKPVPVKVFEKTGAGDAFGSGFIAGLLKKDSVEYAIKLASANAASCISEIGAKNGLLSKNNLGNLPDIKIVKL